MKLVIQRVKNSNVLIDNKDTKNINNGLMLLVGFTYNDTIEDIKYITNKVVNMRIFEDENNKLNLSVKDINGELLIVSQFTLYANASKGNRPSFNEVLKYDEAKILYNEFIEEIKKTGLTVKTGKFGSKMVVTIVNDGPITIIIDSKDR